MGWYVVAAAWFAVSVIVGLIVGDILAGRVSPSGSPHVPSCCPPEGENTP